MDFIKKYPNKPLNHDVGQISKHIADLTKKNEIFELMKIIEARRRRGDLIQFFKLQKRFNLVNRTSPPIAKSSVPQSGPTGFIRGHSQSSVITGFKPRAFFNQ